MKDNHPLCAKTPVNSLFSFKETYKSSHSENRWEYQIQDGFAISCLDIKTKDTLRLEYEKDCTTLNFGFILSGTYSHQIKSPDCNGKELSNHQGTSGILYVPRQEGALVIPGQTHVRVVHIHLSLPVFHNLFYMDRETVPTLLQPLLDGSVHQPYFFRSEISMWERLVLDRLLKGPSLETPSHLFYQGIALDLMANKISRANSLRPESGSIRFDDLDRVILARDILIKNLASPPCLKQLSRKIGLNMNKLQKGFYQIYGVSAFKYLRQYRMQEANRLFHETDMNVSQAASAVGYTNFSHFSYAYKQHFNILPKKHLAAIKS